MSNSIIIIQGVQYGSEAKGGVVAYLAQTGACDVAVRTGSINAGHTVMFQGKKYSTQQLPAAWVHPGVSLVIGPGAYIHPLTLMREIQMIKEATGDDPSKRIMIDYRCHLHTDGDQDKAAKAGRHHLMGATGKGCAEAIVRKIENRGHRLDQNILAANVLDGDFQFGDTTASLTVAYRRGAKVIIEGTQGTQLDLHLGPYPFTTSRMTSPANWIAECGLSPSHNYSIIHVARTLPIRVAGNSGPLPGELSWTSLGRAINGKRRALDLEPIVSPEALDAFDECCKTVAADMSLPLGESGLNLHNWTSDERSKYRAAASELHANALSLMQTANPTHYKEVMAFFETTTVTKKLRRIASMDLGHLSYAAMIDDPSDVVVTFFNYIFPELWGMSAAKASIVWRPEMQKYLAAISAAVKTRIMAVTTGPDQFEHTILLDDKFTPQVMQES